MPRRKTCPRYHAENGKFLSNREFWFRSFVYGWVSFFLFLVFYGTYVQHFEGTDATYFISPQPLSVRVTPTPTVMPTPTATPTPLPQYEEMKAKIKAVFGEHTDKALTVLTGEGCAENRRLDPKAVNDNTIWGGVGRDYGLFQINDYWQGFRHEGKAEQFLMDPDINIRIAWSIYEENGYSFERWTCGRYHNL